MQKPRLDQFNLTQGDIQSAQNAKSRREELQRKANYWIAAAGPLLVAGWVYLITRSIGLTILVGFFGGLFASAIVGGILLGLWDYWWNYAYPAERDRLVRDGQYKAALKAFAEHQQRLAVSFWTSLSGEAFEHELARLHQKLGYVVKLTPYSRDGGIDIHLTRAGENTIVQCKRYNKPVGVSAARELFGVLQSARANRAILASTGGFTTGVREFVRDKPIELLDLQQIIDLQQRLDRLNET